MAKSWPTVYTEAFYLRRRCEQLGGLEMELEQYHDHCNDVDVHDIEPQLY